MNEKKQQFKRKRTLVLLMAMAMNMVFIFTACSSGKAEMSASETDTTKEETVKKEAEEASTPEPTEEPTPEPAEEPKQAASLEEYIAQLDPNEICVVVWNENTNRQENFTEDQKCIVEEGDIVVVPVGERPIMSVYYDSISQEYNEKGYFVVNVENPKWIAISITFQIGEDEYDNICLPAKKQ